MNALKQQDAGLLLNFRENVSLVLKDLLKSKMSGLEIDSLFVDHIRRQSVISFRELKDLFRQISPDTSELEILLLLRMVKKEYLEDDLRPNEGYYNQIIIYLKGLQDAPLLCRAQ